MPFDGLTISFLVRELNEQLRDQRIEKVYQPEKDELTLLVRQRKGNARLVISANPRWGRMYLSRERRENPAQPTSFCMLLRKHLDGAKILEFAQPDFDRIVWIRVEALNDLMEWQEKVLVCEFTGKHANVVLIDPQKNLILDGMKRYGHELSSYREVQPGASYIAPPKQDKIDPRGCGYGEFYQALWNHDSTALASSLFQTVNGLSPVTCKELCLLAGIDPETPVGECGDYELSRLHRLISGFEFDVLPTIVMGQDSPHEYFMFKPVSIGDRTSKTFASVNQAMDEFYRLRLAQTRLESLRVNIARNVQSILDKAYKKLMFQEGDLAQAEKNEALRVYGELLTAYGFQIKKGETTVKLPNFDGKGETEIPLQPHLTPQENAQRYFKQYAKAKKARHRLENLIADNREEITYLESVLLALEKATTVEEIEDVVMELEEQGFIKPKPGRRNKPAKSAPRHFMSTGGLSIRVGKNNHQNEALTLKGSRKNDLWLHAQDYAGAHVILELPFSVVSIEDVPTDALEEAAILAAYYSRGKDAEKVAVDYTFRGNVKKPRGSRPGMVIYDNYWTIYINPTDSRLASLLSSAPTRESGEHSIMSPPLAP